MNKLKLNVFFVILALILLIINIGADGNSTNLSEEYPEKLILQETENSTSGYPENSSNILIELNDTIQEDNLEDSNSTYINDSIINNFSYSTNNSNIIDVAKENSNSGSHYDKEEYYLDLNKLQESNPIKEDFKENNYTEVKKDVCWGYDSLGKKVIEIKDCEKGDIEKINQPEELEKNEFEKEVIISSQSHFEKPVVYYTSLTQETEKENIKIYWKNKGNLDITEIQEFNVTYYDKNQNGLIERVSWIIPHLSEQVFEVIIELNKTNESLNQIFMEVSGPSLNVKNPIIFDINLNYTGEVNCTMSIDSNNVLENFNKSQSYQINLVNGDHTWAVNCIDSKDNSTYNNSAGFFSVNEIFYSSFQEGKMYFLDLIENKIKNPDTITISSTKHSNFVVKIIRNEQIIYTKNFSNSTLIVMNESLINNSGIYKMSVEFNSPSPKTVMLNNFSVASANILFNTTTINEKESVKISTSVSSPIQIISHILVDYGNGTLNYLPVNTNSFVQEFLGKYSQDGTYNVKLNMVIGGVSFEIQKNGITVKKINYKDEASPSITILEPENKEVIYNSAVNFSYKASDNIGIENCTFKLYKNCASINSFNSCSTSNSNLIFQTNNQQASIANNFSVKNNKIIEVKLEDFEEGIYGWLVECYDNSSNYNWETGILQIYLNKTENIPITDYEQKEEVEELKERADDFIKKEFNPEEKEVLEDLSILNDTKYYKKRLLDIEEFFSENYKYVSSDSLMERKSKEYIEELNTMKKKIPKSVTIKESYEYVKNTIDEDLNTIIEKYFESTNTNIGKSSIQQLTKVNKELQNEISVSSKIRNIDIDYGEETQSITLIKKEITLNDNDFTKILEVIPKDVAESAEDITFITKNKIISEDPIFEIDYEDLNKKEIIYYINKQVEVRDIEKTETLLFEDNLNRIESKVTGFFVVDFITLDFTLYFILTIILLGVLLVIVPFMIRKIRIISWKKEPNVIKVINLIEDIKKLLKEKEVEQAREKYHKIQEIYPVLPNKTKPYFYNKIKEILVRIDRKDIFGLVKEYQEAKRKWNKEDYIRLYEDIKKIYERLPEKDRKRVYEILNGY